MKETPVGRQASLFADIRSPPWSKGRRPPLLGPVEGTALADASFLLCEIEYQTPPPPAFSEPGSTQVWLTPKQDLFTAWIWSNGWERPVNIEIQMQ